MLALAHLGIGKRLVQGMAPKDNSSWIYLGAILPDLVDKPLYYVLSAITGKQGLELGMISGTRTFGHTALALMIFTLVTYFKKSRMGASICLGMASHLLLDSLADHVLEPGLSSDLALLWPWKGWQMPVAQYPNLWEHMRNKSNSAFLAAECVGLLFLVLDWKQIKKFKFSFPK